MSQIDLFNAGRAKVALLREGCPIVLATEEEQAGAGSALKAWGRELAGDVEGRMLASAHAEIWRLWGLLNQGPRRSVVEQFGLCDGHKSETGVRLSCGHVLDKLPTAPVPIEMPCWRCEKDGQR
jgi:hypothetical protein